MFIEHLTRIGIIIILLKKIAWFVTAKWNKKQELDSKINFRDKLRQTRLKPLALQTEFTFMI